MDPKQFSMTIYICQIAFVYAASSVATPITDIAELLHSSPPLNFEKNVFKDIKGSLRHKMH